MAWGELRSGRSLERLINFSDAVVAVAITLLALPLSDIAGPTNGQTMTDVLWANFGLIQTFVTTFIVVAIMWSVHNKVVNDLGSYDSAIFWLTILWLMGFAFLPWPSRLYTGPGFDADVSGHGSSDQGGAGTLYWLTLAYISAIGALTARHMRKHPELIEPQMRPHWAQLESSPARFRGMAFAIVFVAAAVACQFVYWIGSYFLLLLIPIGFLLRYPKRMVDDQDAIAEQQEASE